MQPAGRMWVLACGMRCGCEVCVGDTDPSYKPCGVCVAQVLFCRSDCGTECFQITAKVWLFDLLLVLWFKFFFW